MARPQAAARRGILLGEDRASPQGAEIDSGLSKTNSL